MVEPKGENPSPGEKPKGWMVFRVFLKVETWSLTLLDNGS